MNGPRKLKAIVPKNIKTLSDFNAFKFK